MRAYQTILKGCIGLLGGLMVGYAQETEESAEVFLDDYSDTFQEHFFEGLKQKGIENYDRAIHALLQCKEIDKENPVVDYELANLYLETNEYYSGTPYAITAVNGDPDNIWYLHTLVLLLQKDGKTLKDVQDQIPYQHPKLKENLATVYYQQNNYDYALELLNDVPINKYVSILRSNIQDAIASREAKSEKTSFSMVPSSDFTTSTEVSSSKQLEMNIKSAMAVSNMYSVEKMASEAMEAYPTQPYFYYAYGWVLQKKGKNKEAIEVLEMGLDFMLGGNVKLSNDFYKTLAAAYKAHHNPVKADIYLRKVIPGF